jgi:hypothetical protein
MANRLKVGWVQAVYTLMARGWPQRQIAAALGIDRGTMARHVRGARGAPKPAGAPSGSDGPEPWMPPHAARPPAPVPVQPSRCEPFREIIPAKLDQGLSAHCIH